jgi:hypothetical protein
MLDFAHMLKLALTFYSSCVLFLEDMHFCIDVALQVEHLEKIMGFSFR